MKTTPSFSFVFLTLLVSVAFGVCGRAGELSEQEYQAADTVLVADQQMLRHDSKEAIDFMMQGLARAYQSSSYGHDQQSVAICDRLTAEAADLKLEIAEVERGIEANHSADRKSGTMIALLALEQSVAFRVYRWYRSVVEMTDLASAYSGHKDEALGKYHSTLLQLHEDAQAGLSTTICGLGTKFP